MRKLATVLTSAALIFGLMVTGASAQDATPEATPFVSDQAPQRDGVSLAIYNVGTALVQDRRTLPCRCVAPYCECVGTPLARLTGVRGSRRALAGIANFWKPGHEDH